MDDDDDDTEDLTNCQICCEEYSLNDRIPRFLPCTHTICEVCIVQILSMDSKGIVACPECRKEHVINESEGVHTFHQNKYILAHLRKQKQQLRNVDICQEHSRPFSLYCEQEGCRRPICTKCLVEEHNAHTSSDLIEKAQIYKQQFSEEVSLMLDTLNSSKIKGRQANVRQFQKTHEILDVLKERKTMLINMIEEHINGLENKAMQHFNVQSRNRKDREWKLVDAMKSISMHVTEVVRMKNSDVLRHRDIKRQLCQQIVHDVVKAAGFTSTEDLHFLSYEHTVNAASIEQYDEVATIQNLAGKLSSSPLTEKELGSFTADVGNIKDGCNCRLCVEGRKLWLTDKDDVESFLVTMEDNVSLNWEEPDLYSVYDDSNFNAEPEEQGAVGGEAKDSILTSELKGFSDEIADCELRLVSAYATGDYLPKRKISYLKRVDQFTDLCPGPSSGQDINRLKSNIIRVMSLTDGKLKTFGDYGMGNIQVKIFSEDQYMKGQLWDSSSWTDLETVNCEVEVRIGEQDFLARAELNSLHTHYVINFYPKATNEIHHIDLPGRSVRYLCLLDASTMIYAYTESESAVLANVVFCKIGFLQYHPIPEVKSDDFVTDYISLVAICTLTHGPEAMILVCGSCVDLVNPGLPCLTAYNDKGQVLWRRSLVNPHALCTDCFGNLLVAENDSVLLFDANGNYKHKLLTSNKDKLGKEGPICLAFRSDKSQLVVSHVCSSSQVADVKGANGVYDPITVLNFYQIGYQRD